MMSPISRIGLLRHWQKAGGGELKGKAENGPELKYDYCYWNGILCFTLQCEAIGAAFSFSFFLRVFLWFRYGFILRWKKSHAAQVNYMAAL